MESWANVAELPAWARQLIERGRVGRLGLIADDGGPRVLPVTYALFEASLVTAIDDKPKRVSPEQIARVRWLRARPRAALTIDHYEEDWSALGWVQAIGTVAIVEAQAAPGAVAALVERYRHYRERPPDGPVLVLAPERLLGWRAAPRSSRTAV